MAVPKLSKSTGAFESPMITVRDPASIHQVDVQIDRGSCHGRWHFSFDRYFDPRWMRFGTLRVFNDDTLTAGAVGRCTRTGRLKSSRTVRAASSAMPTK